MIRCSTVYVISLRLKTFWTFQEMQTFTAVITVLSDEYFLFLGTVHKNLNSSTRGQACVVINQQDSVTDEWLLNVASPTSDVAHYCFWKVKLSKCKFLKKISKPHKTFIGNLRRGLRALPKMRDMWAHHRCLYL